MLSQDKLPTSSQELSTMVLLWGFSTAAFLGRVLMGKDPVAVRAVVGGVLVAGTVAVMLYGAFVQVAPNIGGYAAAGLGGMAGSFTDVFLKKAQQWAERLRVPGAPEDTPGGGS